MDQPFTGERFWSGETQGFLSPSARNAGYARGACAPRRRAARTSPDLCETETSSDASSASFAPYACGASAATATIIACWRLAPRPRCRGRPQGFRHCPADPDRRAGGRCGLDLGWRRSAKGRSHPCRRRPAAARASGEDTRRLTVRRLRVLLDPAARAGTKASKAAQNCSRIASRSCMISCRAPRSRICEPTLSLKEKVLHRLARDDLVLAGGEHQHRHANRGGNLSFSIAAMAATAACAPNRWSAARRQVRAPLRAPTHCGRSAHGRRSDGCRRNSGWPDSPSFRPAPCSWRSRQREPVVRAAGIDCDKGKLAIFSIGAVRTMRENQQPRLVAALSSTVAAMEWASA